MVNIIYFEKMHDAANTEKLKEEILVLVEKNPEVLLNLPVERLVEIEKMYDEIIEENDKKIAKLEKKLNS